jgi:hypothetical protein
LNTLLKSTFNIFKIIYFFIADIVQWLLVTLLIVVIFIDSDIEQSYIKPYFKTKDIHYNVKTGTLFDSVEVHNLRLFKGLNIDKASLKVDLSSWNKECFVIKYLAFDDVNIELIDSVYKFSQTTSQRKFCIEIEELDIHINSLNYKNIDINQSNIVVKNFVISDDIIKVKDITMDAKKIIISDVTLKNITASVGYLYSDFSEIEAPMVRLKADLMNYEHSFRSSSTPIELAGEISNSALSVGGSIDASIVSHYLPSPYNRRWRKAFNQLYGSFVVTQEGIHADMFTHSDNLFINEYKKYNFHATSLRSHLELKFSPFTLHLESEAEVDSDMGSFLLDNHLYYDKELSYTGTVKSDDFDVSLLNSKLNGTLLNQFKIDYSTGFNKVNIKNRYLNVNIDTQDYKNFSVNSTLKDIYLDEVLKQNDEDYQSDLFFSGSAAGKIYYHDNNLSLKGHYHLYTNEEFLIEGSFDDNITSHGTISYREGGCLNSDLISVKHEKIFPIHYNFSKKEEHYSMQFEHDKLLLSLDYLDKNLDAFISMNSYSTHIYGMLDPKMSLQFYLELNSFLDLQNNLSDYIDFEPTLLDFKSDINVLVTGDILDPVVNINMKNRDILFGSKSQELAIESFDITMSAFSNTLAIDSYNLYIKGRHFYADESSYLFLDSEKIYIKDFVVNNSPILNGFYEFKGNNLITRAKSEEFYYEGPEGKYHFSMDINGSYNYPYLSLKGDLNVKSAEIRYKASNELDALDEDIVVIQERQKENHFKEFLALDIHIHNKEALVYKDEDIEVSFNVDADLYKSLNESLSATGTLNLLRGYYDGFGRTFKLQPSEVVLTADREFNPYLNIKAETKAKNVSIEMAIRGRLKDPEIFFASSPALSETDILSLILFDSTAGELASTTSTENSSVSYSLLSMSTVFAGDLGKAVGVRINRLNMITTEDGNYGFEVGARISSKISVSYITSDTSRVSIQYELTDHFATEVQVGKEDNSMDLIYQTQY